MQVHLPTLIVVLVSCMALQTLTMFVVFRAKSISEGPGWWTLGQATITAGFLLLVVGQKLHAGIAAFLAGTAFWLAGIACFQVGLLRYFGERAVPSAMLAGQGATVALVAYFSYVHQDFAFSRSIAALAFSACGWPLIRTLFRYRKQAPTATQILIAVFASLSFFYLLRAVALWPVHINGNALIEGGFQGIPGPLLASFQASGFVTLAGSLLWTSGFITLVHQRMLQQQRDARDSLEVIFNTSPDMVVVTQLSDGVVVRANAPFVAMTGYATPGGPGQGSVNLALWKHPEQLTLLTNALADQGAYDNLEATWLRANGSPMLVLISAKVLYLHGLPHILTVARNISERKQMKEALARSEAKFRTLYNATSEAVMILNEHGFLDCNDATVAMFGCVDKQQFCGKRPSDLAPPEQPDGQSSLLAAQAHIRTAMTTGRDHFEYLHCRADNGVVFAAEVLLSALELDGERVMMASVRNIDDRKQNEQKINQLIRELEVERDYAQANAMSDSLTRVANRRAFDEALRTEFYRLKRSGGVLTILMLDVDFFKNFNDLYGHAAGDECLRLVAECLKAMVHRAPDLVGRYGGEEFAILLPETDREGGLAVGERVRKGIAELAIAHASSTVAGVVTVSVGVVTTKTDDAATPEHIMELADQALYRAKRAGRNRLESAPEPESKPARKQDSQPTMVRLVWRAAAESGHRQTDLQHQALFAAANQLLAVAVETPDPRLCVAQMSQIVVQIQDHFRQEERLLARIGFPDALEHLREHERELAKCMTLLSQLSNGTVSMETAYGFIAYEMIAQHVFMHDQKFFPYLAQAQPSSDMQ